MQETEAHKSLSTCGSDSGDSAPELYSEAVTSLVKYRKMFELHDDTLFLCIDILKMYMQGGRVASDNLVPVTIACLMLAAKYNEIFPPELAEITDAFDYYDSEEELFEVEGDVLAHCRFELPTRDNIAALIAERCGHCPEAIHESTRKISRKISAP